jgi:SulP family sulfate permease
MQRIVHRAPSRGEIANNAIAGLIVGIIAVPLSIALAVAVGVPPIAGLYTAVFAGAVAAIFGGSRFNITGPTAALVPLLAHVVLRHGPEALAVVAVLAGLMLIAMGFLHFGRLVRYMPGLVVVGFTAGIALSIGFGQLNALLGVTGTDPTREHFHEQLWDTLTHLSTVGWETPAIALASVAFLGWWQGRGSRIPGPLIVVLLATAAAWGLGLDVATIESRYGDLPAGLPTPSFDFFDLGLAFDLLPSAMAVAVLAGVESLLSAVVADGMSATRERHDSDRELVGQGLANIVAPVMGGIPATAAIARTAAGIRNGATSRLTGVFHAGTVLALTLAFGDLAGHIPLAALAAILVVVAWNIADVPELAKLIRSAPREDLLVLLGTMGVTLIFDLTFAITAGILASTVLLLRRLIRVPAARELLPDERGRVQDVPEDLGELIRSHPEIVFFNAQGVISFHSAAAFENQLSRHDTRPMVLRMKDVHHVDSSGLLTLEGIIEHRRRVGADIVLTDVQPDLAPVLERFGVSSLLGPEGLCQTTEEAIARFHGAAAHDGAIAFADEVRSGAN